MIGMIAGAIINIGLDPLFIFVFDWGVRGASAATAISKLISFIILLIPYIRKKSLLRISIRHIKYTVEIVSEVLKMGSPSLLRNGLSTIAAIILNNMAAGYSESALAAISVVNRIIFFLTAISLGFGQGFQPVAGFSWGAGRYDRIIQGYCFASIVGVIGMSIIALIVAIFAEPIISLFTETDTELIRIGVFSMYIQCLATPIHTWAVVVNMLYAGLGKAGGAALLGMARQGICFFPLLPFLSFFGVYGVAAVQGVADMLTIFLALPLAVKALRELRALAEGQQKEQPVAAAVPEALEE